MQNRPPQLPKHVEDKESLESSLLGLLRDVDSYIAELNEDSNTSTTPTRSHSLQQTQKQTSPPTVFRSSTTYRPQVSEFMHAFISCNLTYLITFLYL